jgi:hypothetical protein
MLDVSKECEGRKRVVEGRAENLRACVGSRLNERTDLVKVDNTPTMPARLGQRADGRDRSMSGSEVRWVLLEARVDTLLKIYLC